MLLCRHRVQQSMIELEVEFYSIRMPVKLRVPHGFRRNPFAVVSMLGCSQLFPHWY